MCARMCEDKPFNHVLLLHGIHVSESLFCLLTNNQILCDSYVSYVWIYLRRILKKKDMREG